ncbi:MAG: thiolase family protein [Pseudomonadota bacterium]
MAETVIAGGRRTPLAAFGGALKDLEMTEMAGATAAAALSAAGMRAEAVDHMVFTTTVPSDRDSLFAARVVGVKSGIPEAAGALHVVRACASGLQAILSADQQVASGHSRIALAGGAESYSRAPFATTTIRWGAQRGPQQLDDMLDWAYRCPFSQDYMGETAETLADRHQITREAMDEWGAMSQARALEARRSGFLAEQIAPVTLTTRKGETVFAEDECPREDATAEKLARLRPAFRKDGRVTAGNASTVNDAAAFVLVGDRAALEAEGVAPRARIVDWDVVGVPPEIMGHGPVPAIRRLLERNALRISDIDYFEINEAFAAVNLNAERHLGIPRDLHNAYGGGISLGHPPGVTGVRMAMTALQHLEATGGRRAVLSMCLGAGQGMAMLIERVAA